MSQDKEHTESDFQKFIKQNSHMIDNWPDSGKKMRSAKLISYTKGFKALRVTITHSTMGGISVNDDI